MATPENTITYHNALKILHKHCLQFLLVVKMHGPRETENNTNVKFWGDKQRALWYVMVFLEWSIVLLMIPLIVYKPFNLIQDEVFEFEKEEVGEGGRQGTKTFYI